ncbi:phage major capsid protein [Oceaniglobus ichthyenteri]|uniref:phage major capsid protein n=1 Tax=Oceaniglobus ichthyenteri TaxID=2136177 RepID=UPI000D387DD0|nr:phage major capsid protein [Oceaniglobus ichthyenteri]
MFITDESKAIKARKEAIDFHTRNKIKSINDLTLHTMAWTDLNGIEKEARKAASEMLDRVSNGTSEQMDSASEACDAFSDLLGEIRTEKDERTFIGNKGPRERRERSEQLAKRPGIDAVDQVRTDGMEAEAAEASYALAPEQRFTAWAQARDTGSEYRGLGLGQYLRAMVLGGKSDLERRALSEGTDGAGGYTVPDALSAQLIDRLRAQSVAIRAGAITVPLTSDQNYYAKLLTDPTPAWRDEAGAVAESDPTFGRVSLTPQSLAVQVKVSQELLEDSLNIGTALPNVLAAAMGLELDRVALLGTGTPPEPRGLANTSGIGTFAQDAGIASYANLSKARTGILSANAGPVSAYIMHPRDEGAFTDLTDGQGQPLMAPKAVADIPILTTTAIPVDGGTGTDESTIFAGNFAHLMLGIRQDIRIELLKTSTYASNLQYTFLAHMRADVAVAHAGAFFTLTGVGKGA